MNHATRYVFLLFIVALGCAPAWADKDSRDDDDSWDDEERAHAIIAGDYFGAGATPGPDTRVVGDAFVAGGEVTVNTEVAGDAVLSGGSIHVGNRVGSDLYAAGGNIVVDATVGHNARLAGGRIFITRHADIAGNMTLAGSRLRMDGRSGGAFSAFGESVSINGEINGGAAVVARSLVVGPNARIKGRLTYRTAKPPNISPEAVITGGVKKSEFEFPEMELEPVAEAAAWISSLILTAGMFVIGALIILLIPRDSARVARQIRLHPLGTPLLGFALIVCIPVAALLAMVTVIGIPLGFVLIFLWPVVVLLGYLAGVVFLGDAVASLFARAREGSAGRGLRILALALVLVAVMLVVQVPILGALLVLAVLFAGTGALVFGVRNTA